MWWSVFCEALSARVCLRMEQGNGLATVVEVHAVGTDEIGNPVALVWHPIQGFVHLRPKMEWGYTLTDKASQAPRRGYLARDLKIKVIDCKI